MKRYPANPTRFVDLPTEAPVRVGLLIRSAIAEPGEDTPRVKWRIRNTLRARVEQRSRWLRLALVGACMFVMGGVVGAAVQPLLRSSWFASTARTEVGASLVTPHGARKRAQVQILTSVPPPSVTADGSGAAISAVPPPGPAGSTTDGAAPTRFAGRLSTQTAPPRPPSAATPPAPRLAPPVAAPVMLAPGAALPPSLPVPAAPAPTVTAAAPAASASEQALIATALDKLRTAREPNAALAVLDEYHNRFPTGVLTPEADRLRTEALLLLGRKATVLDELDRAAVSETPASDERLLLRGELRAGAGRWRAALADFDAVMRAYAASGANPDDQRSRERLDRALWGRASARSHLGDESGARDDLHEYLRRFPDGRFAARAGRVLEERRPP